MAYVPPYQSPMNVSGFLSNKSDALMSLLDLSRNCSRSNVLKSPGATSAGDFVFRIIINVCIVGLLCLIGFVGNSLTFVILRSDRDKNSTTNWLLQTLAVVDIVYLVACIFIQPIKAIHELYPETEWRPGSTWSSVRTTYTHVETYIWPLASIAQTVTIWVVVLVTVDRYIAICMPLRSKIRTLPRARAAVAVVIVAAILYNVPLFFEKTVSYIKTCDGRYKIQIDPTDLKVDTSYFVVYKTICYFVFRTIGPLLLLIILNARLIRALRQMRRRHRYLTRRNQQRENAVVVVVVLLVVLVVGATQNQQRENVTLTLVVVVSVFIACELSDLGMRIGKVLPSGESTRIYIACELPDTGVRIAVTLREVVPSIELDRDAFRYRVTTVTNALLTLNSAANFFIYCLIGHKFRRILVRMCRAACCGGHHAVGAGGSSLRRQTGGAGRGAASRGIETAGDEGGKDDENGLFIGTPQPSMTTRMSIAMTTCTNQTVVVEPTPTADTSHSRYI